MELWNALVPVLLFMLGWVASLASTLLAERRAEVRRQRDRRDAYRRDLSEAILEGRELYGELGRWRIQVADGRLGFDDIVDLFQHVAGHQRRFRLVALEHPDKAVREVAEQCDQALWISVAALQMIESSQHLLGTYSDPSDAPDEYRERVEKWIANARDEAEEFKALVDRLAALKDDE